MKKPLVTVIIPVYNCEKYIERCLKSVMDQSYAELEILVIDDGSKDRSAEVIRKLASADERVCFFYQKNAGVSAVRNKGAALARGKYLTFVDGDDYLGRTYIENFVFAAESAAADLCVCGYTMVAEDGKQLFHCEPSDCYIRNEHEEYPYRILATLSRFYRTEFWRRYSVFYEESREIRGEDIPVALLTNAVAANIQCVMQRDYFYVQHDKSARHMMRGLEVYRLPYNALESCIRDVSAQSEKNGWDFFELGVFRVFVTFLLDLGRGTTLDKFDEIYYFEMEMVKKYLGNYRKNKCLRLFSGLDIPFGQRAAVKVYLSLLKCHLLYPFARLIRKCC